MDFYSHYEHLCAVQGCIPIASVLAKKSHGTLDLNADRIKAPDWAPLLTALRHNKTLTSIAIRTSHYRSQADSGIDQLLIIMLFLPLKCCVSIVLCMYLSRLCKDELV